MTKYGAGLVPPAAALFLLGRGGAILMVIMLFMAVTSSGSAELVAVSSLFTYDVYRTYINPNATGALPARLPVSLRLGCSGSRAAHAPCSLWLIWLCLLQYIVAHFYRRYVALESFNACVSGCCLSHAGACTA